MAVSGHRSPATLGTQRINCRYGKCKLHVKRDGGSWHLSGWKQRTQGCCNEHDLAAVDSRNWTRPAASWRRSRLPVWIKMRRTLTEQNWSAMLRSGKLTPMRGAATSLMSQMRKSYLVPN